MLDIFKKKLMSEISHIDKTEKEYEDELKDKLYSNRKIASTISIQFEEIQRLMGELKFEKNTKSDFKLYLEQCMRLIFL